MRFTSSATGALLLALSTIASAQNCDVCPDSIAAEVQTNGIAYCGQTYADINECQDCVFATNEALREQGCNVPVSKSQHFRRMYLTG
jgi:hypothetical protein